MLYVVRLSGEERERLETLIRKGKSPARRVLKARILLKADVSEAIVAEEIRPSHIVRRLNLCALNPSEESFSPTVSSALAGRRGQQRLKMGLEGIVSKRKDSMYRSGHSSDWLKMKNAAAPAVKREEEEDWGR